jgi:type IV secretory pathway TraG/TraD family ATPase VirD4
MPDIKWGRKETIIWPPRKPIYTLGALVLAAIATGLFVYLRFTFGMTPLEKYYLPLYLKTEITGSVRPAGQYQLLFVSDGKRRSRLATDLDVDIGITGQPAGKPLPLKLSADTAKQGWLYLFRGPVLVYQNKPLHTYLKQAIYGNDGLISRFELPLTFGLIALLLQLPFSILKDIRRRREMKYGRRLKGPVMVTPKQFNKAVCGTGIGIKTDDCKDPLRIPRAAEDQHIEIIGDTGTGKTTLIMQLLRQIQARGHSAIVYDPACEFIQRFYDESRGDIVLNPLDKRCPYWGPSEELVRWAEAKTIAVSLFQPTTDRKGEFFIESPQKIFAHLLLDLPTPTQLVAWMSNPEDIDHRVKGTELAALIDPKAPQQRSGVLASLGLIADSFRLLPRETETNARWTAREWSEDRKGWIFITSQPAEREALRPLHSLWIDMLVLRLLTASKEGQRPVWFVLDELASLQKLPQLHTAITENRKSRNPIILGFQGKAQLEVIYGHLAEVMLSQPATKIFLKTTEPNAAEWVSKAIGRVEIERMRETHYDGSRDGRNFSLERQVEALVLDSEISGLENLRAFLKYGNHVTRFSFSYMNLPAEQPKFLERLVNDYIDRSPQSPAAKTETQTGAVVSTTKPDLPLAKEKSHKEQIVARQGELWQRPRI